MGDKYPWIDKFPAFTIDLKVSREVCTVFFITQLSCLLRHLHIALLLKGATLVHLLLRNSAAHDYWKYIVSSVIFHATCRVSLLEQTVKCNVCNKDRGFLDVHV